uniref:Coiled-coil domain-containing protein 96 n=1 Tax=Syphacia muris TaxID=451379 RepID=A0A0N5AKX4_9BILA
MAEDLEADPSVDADRATDRRNFMKEQFDVLLYKYRELDDDNGGEFCLKQNALIKKELLNAKHNLRKGKYFLQTLPMHAAYADLIERINLTCSKIDKMTKDVGSSSDEFSLLDASLPDYEAEDIELLNLNPSKDETLKISLLSVSDQQKIQEQMAFLGECNILIKECHDITEDLKK